MSFINNHKLGYVTYKKAFQKEGRPRPSTTPKIRRPQEKVQIWLVRLFADGHFNTGQGEDRECEGGDENWPEWVSVNRLAEAATLDLGFEVKSYLVGFMLKYVAAEIEHKQVELVTLSSRGTVSYRVLRKFYRIGPFRYDILTPTPRM